MKAARVLPPVIALLLAGGLVGTVTVGDTHARGAVVGMDDSGDAGGLGDSGGPADPSTAAASPSASAATSTTAMPDGIPTTTATTPAATGPDTSTTTPPSTTPAPPAPSPPYWSDIEAHGGTGTWALERTTGRVAVRGTAVHYGDLVSAGVGVPAVDIAARPQGDGYWILTEDGNVHAFGAADYFGSVREFSPTLYAPLAGMHRTAYGMGYWLLSATGELFTFGEAPMLGDLVGAPAESTVAMTMCDDRPAYWLLGADGGVSEFGGGMFGPGTRAAIARPVDIAATPSCLGYWILWSDGVVEAKGDAAPLGNAPAGATALAPTPAGDGYWVLREDGATTAFGDAPA